MRFTSAEGYWPPSHMTPLPTSAPLMQPPMRGSGLRMHSLGCKALGLPLMRQADCPLDQHVLARCHEATRQGAKAPENTLCGGGEGV